MSWSGKGPGENRRVDSWKEIATFFGRDERTVKRWEKTRFLPVHRIPGSKRGGVFAYTHELTEWLHSSHHEASSFEQESPGSGPEPIVAIKPDTQTQSATADSAVFPTKASRVWMDWAVAGLGVALLAVSILGFHFRGTREVVARAVPGPAHAGHLQNAEAEEFYLRGRYDWNRRTSASLNNAVDEFTQAIVHDPSDAKAYAGLADTYDLLREYTAMPASEAYPRAIAAASKAVALDDTLSEAHRALAFGLFNWKWDIQGAMGEYRKAIQLDPKDIEAHHWYATALLSLGKVNESLAEIEQARRLDPTSPAILADRGLILFTGGDHVGGIAALRNLERTEPRFLSPPRYLARMFFAQKDYPNYLDQSERAAAISRDPQELALAEAARRGWSAGGERGLLDNVERVQRTALETDQSSAFQLAYTCLLLGRKKQAIQYLKAAYSAHDPDLFLIDQSRFEADLKGDPDFERLKMQMQAYRR